MVVKYFSIFAINALLLSLALNPQTALADKNQNPSTGITPYNLSYHAVDNFEPFTATPADIQPARGGNIIFSNNNDSSFKSNFTENERSVEESILAQIPYGENFKYMWNVVDGDVDLHFEGLRADRGNTGIAYKTNTVPFIGDVEGLQLKFEAGREQSFSFETNKMPLVGTIEGFNFKGSVGDNSKVFARYTIAFD
jgi:hypothetical protein